MDVLRNRWSDAEALAMREKYASLSENLALCVYASRLIGADRELVMHGGGNTSVKDVQRNILGDDVEVLCVKGSGWELDTMEPQGLPAVDLPHLRRLRALRALSDEEMVNQLRTHLSDASAPTPSVETLLHAFLPHRFIFHTHADAIVLLTNQPNNETLCREVFGGDVVLVPYIMPGFTLAKLAAECFERQPTASAMILLKHGLVTFADSARTAYERTVEMVATAERYIASKVPQWIKTPGETNDSERCVAARRAYVQLGPVIRRALAAPSGNADVPYRRMILEFRTNDEILARVADPSCHHLSQCGCLTPDHVIRTKAYPLFMASPPLDDPERFFAQLEGLVKDYMRRYEAYFAAQVAAKGIKRTQLDAYPRVLLIEGLGLVCAGKTRKDACIAADIMEHTLRVKATAHAMGGYEALNDSDLFDMEYWSLEQAKLGKEVEKPLARQVAVITGAAGAIGVATAIELAKAGAHLVLTDINEDGLKAVATKAARAGAGALGVATCVVNVTDEDSVAQSFARAVLAFGGVDIVVPNAGIAHVSSLAQMDLRAFQRVLDVNLTGYFLTMREAARLFGRQRTGGNIVVNASKNVFGPGESFGAYSASKAGGHQLSKVAAMELAEMGVRVNMINADAVFSGDADTPSGLWAEIGPDRARSKKIAPEALEEHYRERNLLHARVTGEHVGRAVVFFASNLTPTTGATLPVDGGVAAAFPR